MITQEVDHRKVTNKAWITPVRWGDRGGIPGSLGFAIALINYTAKKLFDKMASTDPENDLLGTSSATALFSPFSGKCPGCGGG
jgi:hypothetical protein